jgi:hypothetical protein
MRAQNSECMQGQVEVFSSGGKLLKKFTASHTNVTVAKVFGSLVWLGLCNGRVVAIDTATLQRCAAIPVHDTAVQDIQQVPDLLCLSEYCDAHVYFVYVVHEDLSLSSILLTGSERVPLHNPVWGQSPVTVTACMPTTHF